MLNLMLRHAKLDTYGAYDLAPTETNDWSTLGAVYPTGWGKSAQTYSALTPNLNATILGYIASNDPYNLYSWSPGGDLTIGGTGSSFRGIAVERVYDEPVLVQSMYTYGGVSNRVSMRHVAANIAVRYPDNALIWLSYGYVATSGTSSYYVSTTWTGNVVATKVISLWISRPQSATSVSGTRRLLDSRVNHL